MALIYFVVSWIGFLFNGKHFDRNGCVHPRWKFEIKNWLIKIMNI